MKPHRKYIGLKDACDGCGKTFKAGDLISVELSRNLVFCAYEQNNGACIDKWNQDHGESKKLFPESMNEMKIMGMREFTGSVKFIIPNISTTN
ncbi:hypothetical protein HY967_05205 [Candidatus Jorgensenbacteria bacterium]|nr:hypothetical protein [Candidatus Jorgensenbacteria bacterium]